jgi:dihydrofolate synthase / folylpolyglutamate synthase
MTYEQTLDYLYRRLPMFQRQGPQAYKKDLGNTLALCEALGQPEKRFPSVHIAGTNGKGSVAHMLASVLRQAGYRTGLYTSPHLVDFRERIRIDGRMMARESVVNAVADLQPLIERIQPSFFELTVAMAFAEFARQQVDIAVIETGLGGRLDSTNVITPLVSVITSIGRDHQALLGDTLELIAGEKAGIIKPGIPAIIGEYRPETWPVFEAKARSCSAPLLLAAEAIRLLEWTARDFGWAFSWEDQDTRHELFCDLGGHYQQANLRSVLATVLELRTQGWAIPDSAISAGLARVRQLSGFRGRWDVLQREPLLVVDGAHNPEGLETLFSQVRQLGPRALHIVCGTVNDKELSQSLACYPADARYYFCRPDIPRGLSGEELQRQASAFGLIGGVYSSVASAVEQALREAEPEDMVLVCGSLFVVAEMPYAHWGWPEPEG